MDQLLTQGNLGPPLDLQLQNADGSAPDLTGVTLSCLVQPADRSRRASTTTATLLDARGAFVRHAWVAEETRVPGLLLIQFNDPASGRTWPVGRSYEVLVQPVLR